MSGFTWNARTDLTGAEVMALHADREKDILENGPPRRKSRLCYDRTRGAKLMQFSVRCSSSLIKELFKDLKYVVYVCYNYYLEEDTAIGYFYMDRTRKVAPVEKRFYERCESLHIAILNLTAAKYNKYIWKSLEQPYLDIGEKLEIFLHDDRNRASVNKQPKKKKVDGTSRGTAKVYDSNPCDERVSTFSNRLTPLHKPVSLNGTDISSVTNYDDDEI